MALACRRTRRPRRNVSMPRSDVVGRELEAALAQRCHRVLRRVEVHGAHAGVARGHPQRERLEHVVHGVLVERQLEGALHRARVLQERDAVLEEDQPPDGRRSVGDHRARVHPAPRV
jgi:hypothetical protein